MTKDPRDKEEEFIAGLALDTGRDLAAWMALIDAQTFAHRNDMIDWLRRQNLTFAKASRLERIHHNGGRPMYGERPAEREPVTGQRPPATATAAPPSASLPLVPLVQPAPAPAPPEPADLATFLAKAKGYRPLAEMLIRTIQTNVAATALAVHENHIDLAAPALFGAIAVTAKDVRLALDLGDVPFEWELKRLKWPGMAPSLTHTIVLSDARKVDRALMLLVTAAAARANS